MHVRVLGSSSAGNCTLIWNSEAAVMVDCGFSRTYVRSCLESLDLDIPPIAGLLITHVHGDHVNDSSIDMLVQNGIPVIVRRELTRVLRRMYPSMQRAARAGPRGTPLPLQTPQTQQASAEDTKNARARPARQAGTLDGPDSTLVTICYFCQSISRLFALRFLGVLCLSN